MSKLYVVGTPIGNLSDLTPRAASVLEGCDLILAEDTRVTGKLLSHLGIKKPMLSCHRHNEDGRAPEIIDRMLKEELNVALTCDAGTPAISDPGSEVVAAVWAAGIAVEPVCGASAVVTALSACGFDTREFAFYGFLPRESKPLKEKLISIAEMGPGCAVLYESPHRVTELLKAICDTLPGSEVCVCCDLSKKFERIDRGDCGEVLSRLSANPNTEKGEYCIVLKPRHLEKAEPKPALEPEHLLLDELLKGLTLTQACAALKAAGLKRNDIYRARLRLSALLGGGENDE